MPNANTDLPIYLLPFSHSTQNPTQIIGIFCNKRRGCYLSLSSILLQLDVGAPQRLQLLPSNCAGCHCGGGQLAAADYCAAAPRKSAARRGRLSHRRSSRASEDKARGPQLLEHPPAPLVTSHLDKSTTALSCSFLAKTQLLRDSSWLRTQLLGTYGRTDDPQWRRSCSCDAMGAAQ